MKHSVQCEHSFTFFEKYWLYDAGIFFVTYDTKAQDSSYSTICAKAPIVSAQTQKKKKQEEEKSVHSAASQAPEEAR